MLNLRHFFLCARTKYRLKSANKFYIRHEYKKAIPLYQKILHDNPKHYGALCNLATAYFEDGNYKNALPYFLQLQKIDSINPWWHTYLSQIYQQQKFYRKALNAALQAVEISKGATEHQVNLAYAFYEIAFIKGRDFVADSVQKFYNRYSDSGIAQQCYHTFFSSAESLACNAEYVEKIFDIFAPEFDKILHNLHYESPDFIARILSDFFFNNDKNITILDLGCGSGLCGQAIKKLLPFAEIFGVDISSQMLHEADAKHIYTHLIKQDIINYLSTSNYFFNAITASDVFTYFGSLDDVFAAVFSHLKSGGIFVFTISQNQKNRKNFYLNYSSRFTHNFTYVKKQLQKNGFRLKKIHQKVLRQEAGKDVCGGIFVAIKI